MEKLIVKLANAFEFEVDEITEDRGGMQNIGALTIRAPIKSDVNLIEENLTSDNLKSLSVIGSGKTIFEFKGYTNVLSTNKIINKTRQIFNIVLGP